MKYNMNATLLALLKILKIRRISVLNSKKCEIKTASIPLLKKKMKKMKKNSTNICRYKKSSYLCTAILNKALRQQQTPTLKRPVRPAVRTPDFHSGNRGSIPLRATNLTKGKSERIVPTIITSIIIRCYPFVV
jgi:hypothetical protein